MTLLNNGFYTASTAREIALGGAVSGSSDIIAEVNLLRSEIDMAAKSGNLELVLVTPLGLDMNYFNSWNAPDTYNTSADILRRERLRTVANYFHSLGYNIYIERDGTNNAFRWVVKW